jgi:hypothetical protein
MDEQDIINQQNAIAMGRTAYMTQDNSNMNTLLLELLNVDKLLDRIELELQGLEYDEKGKLVKRCEALCNKEGAANIKRLMLSMVNNVIQMSNFEEEQIRVMTIELGCDLVEVLTFNKVRYEITSPKAITSIIDVVLSNDFACAMGSLENGMRQMLKKTTMETTINTQGNQMKAGKGGIGSLLGLGRK